MTNYAKDIETIRAFRNDPELAVTYLARQGNPYADEGTHAIDIYRDDKGNIYWIDASSAYRGLVQFGPEGQPKSAASVPGLTDSLYPAALAVIGQQIPDFVERFPSLTRYTDNRRGQIYFYRFEKNQPLTCPAFPPFVQVGIYPDGTLACFTNTLTTA